MVLIIYIKILFLDLKKINYSELNRRKEQFLPIFFLSQILDVVSLERLKFNKAEIEKTVIAKMVLLLKNKNITS